MSLNLIPLKQALLCLDCETICEAPRDACPACAHKSLHPLSSFINRPTPAVSAQFRKDDDCNGDGTCVP